MASSSMLLKMCLSSIMLSLLLIFISPSFSSPTYPASNDLSFSSTTSLPKLVAEKLIRGLNLFPKDFINTIENGPRFVPGNIMEKKFKFPGVVDTGPSVKEFGHYAGYYSLPRSKAARMFYLFFESRSSKDDPVVIWLQGGPGCSSELALFYENGPFKVTKNLSLIWNEYGWDKTSNILFVDQPIGTGFSYTTDESDICHDEAGVSNDLYDFLQAFFKEHPQFVKNDFYITGESYGGHYIPALASRVNQGNKAKEGIQINLKGFSIGNGLTNPGIQYQAYTDFALDMGLIKKGDYDSINKLIPPCEQATKTCGTKGGDTCITALNVCNDIFDQILNILGNINFTEFTNAFYYLNCSTTTLERNVYDFSNVETFLNKKTVKEALGVGDLDFVSCSSTVYDAMLQDWMRNLEVVIPALLEDGIKVLVYAGEEDLICNWIGNSRWVHAMEWSSQKEFGAAPTSPFLVDGEEAGTVKSHGPLTFLKVKEAGHMVPMDQPQAALQMLYGWMHGKLIMTRGGDNIYPKLMVH